MKFIVSTSDLLRQLDLVDGVVVSKPMIPILENFLFDIQSNTLRIVTTDLETFMTTDMPVEADDSVSIAIPTKVSLSTLKNLPQQPITFSIEKDKNEVEINSGSGRYKLTGQSGSDFPKVPEVVADHSITMSASVLLEAINKTLFATGSDELRLNLTGLFVQLFEGEINFVATDANRLVCYKRADVKPGVEHSFILPKKAVNLLKNSLPSDDTPVRIDFNKAYAFFSFGHVNLICRLIDERYPDYNAVIPKENPNKLIVNKAAFVGALTRTGLYANKTTHQVRLKIAGSELNLFAEDFDVQNEAQERLTCSYEGKDIEIGFNARFLLDMMQVIHTDEVVIELSQPNRAGLVSPSIQDAGSELRMVIMPMMLNTN